MMAYGTVIIKREPLMKARYIIMDSRRVIIIPNPSRGSWG